MPSVIFIYITKSHSPLLLWKDYKLQHDTREHKAEDMALVFNIPFADKPWLQIYSHALSFPKQARVDLLLHQTLPILSCLIPHGWKHQRINDWPCLSLIHVIIHFPLAQSLSWKQAGDARGRKVHSRDRVQALNQAGFVSLAPNPYLVRCRGAHGLCQHIRGGFDYLEMMLVGISLLKYIYFPVCGSNLFSKCYLRLATFMFKLLLPTGAVQWSYQHFIWDTASWCWP